MTEIKYYEQLKPLFDFIAWLEQTRPLTEEEKKRFEKAIKDTEDNIWSDIIVESWGDDA